jgi:hypothetical protein
MIKRCHLLHGKQVAAAEELQQALMAPHFILIVPVFLYMLYLTRSNQPLVLFPVPQENILYTWWLYCPIRGGL